MTERHARLTELFTRAVELPAAGRDALIAELRAQGDSLAEELADLIATDAELGDASLPLAPVVLGHGPPPVIEIPGYRVQSVLAEGGMGVVYLAEQLAPRRTVAIKVLHALSPQALARFRGEAEIMARLDHPGIARVLAAGETAGRPYLVMEHVVGHTLDHHARALPAARRIAPVVDLVIATCDAVAHAHSRGVVHRDLKPANLMVRTDGRIAVLDFGVARVAEGSAATRAGELLGTPLYMSPEQARLRPDAADAASDVYTLGVILYELLCGELPYPLAGLTLPQVMAAICEVEPAPLGARDPALRGDLEAITGKALAKPRDQRYPSAAALADDLRRFRRGLPVAARPVGRIARARRFARRQPWPAAAAAAGAALTAALIVLGLAARSAHRDAAHRAVGEALHHARTVMASDPTAALALLAKLDGAAAWAIADEALGRGVAHVPPRVHDNEIRWIEGIAGSDAFVTGSYDGRVVVWQAPGDRPRVVYQAPHRVHAARPSPDGSVIAVGGDDGLLAVIGQGGELRARLAGHAGKVERLAWSPGGALVSADDHGNVWLWPDGRGPGQHLAASGAVIGSVAFSGDGRAVVGGDHAGRVWWWAGDPAAPLTAEIDAEVIDTWTDGARVVAVDAAGAVHRWQIRGGALIAEPVVTTGSPAKRAVFAPDGSWLVIGGVGGVATRVAGGAASPLAVHHAQVRCLAIRPDGGAVATASDDGALQVVELASGRRRVLRGHRGRIRHIAFSGGGLLSADGEGAVRRWDLAATPATVLEGGDAALARLVASADASVLAALDRHGDLVRWTIATGAGRPLGRAPGDVTALAVAGDAVITGTASGAVTWWGDRPARARAAGGVTAIAAGGPWVAVASRAGPIALFTAAGEQVAEVDGNLRGSEALAFDRAATHLAAGGQDREIRVWRVADRALVPIARLRGPDGDSHVVRFSPAGDRLFAGGNDGSVVAWSIADGAIDPASRAVLAHHVGAVGALAVAADGRFVASAGRDATVFRIALPAGAAEPIGFGAAPSELVVDRAGWIAAVTRAGALVGEDGAVIAEGVQASAALGGDRIALGLADGVIVLAAVRGDPSPLAARIAPAIAP